MQNAVCYTCCFNHAVAHPFAMLVCMPWVIKSTYVCALQVFTEAEVRASLVFQVSKLCSCMLKAARLATGGAAWDALVAGQALHTLLHTLHHMCSLLCICRVTAGCMTLLSMTRSNGQY